jgi:segregation and condensation protein A
MVIQKNDTFTLHNFEGPLDFLLHLVQREEIEVYDVSIQELIQQFLNKLSIKQGGTIHQSAEFIGMASYLVWLKSKTLLPKQEQPFNEEKEEDPHFKIIHHLIDYCRFKQAAKTLAQRQEEQNACFSRGIPTTLGWKKPLGIDHLALEDLSLLFKEMIKRIPPSKEIIYEENWRVSDQVHLIRRLLQSRANCPIEHLFVGEKSRLELIVTFLAILELMKIGFLAVGKDERTQAVWIFSKNEGYA